MVQLNNAELSEAYTDLRTRVLTIGRSLTEAQASAMTPCCPAWSVKDTIAHLAGITSDILSGNTEGAATEAWADAQVEGRRAKTMEDVCLEWETNAPQIDDLLGAMGTKMPPQLYIDAWTHECDIRQATGIGAEPDMRFVDHTWDFLFGAIEDKNGGPLGVEIDRFELARIAMGRRSRAQIEALGLRPEGVVIWTPNEVDIVDAPRTALR